MAKSVKGMMRQLQDPASVEDIGNAHLIPAAEARECVEAEPAFLKFVVVFTVAMVVANVALMKIMAG